MAEEICVNCKKYCTPWEWTDDLHGHICIECREKFTEEGMQVPFKSQKQAAYLFAKKPKIAKEFSAKTKSIKALPVKVKKRK